MTTFTSGNPGKGSMI